MATTAVPPFQDSKWKIPGYTGYIQGIRETSAKTPVMAQLETYTPPTTSYLYTRAFAPPVPTPERDLCNQPEEYLARRKEPINLWPSLQASGRQEMCPLAVTNVALGDLRVRPSATSYAQDFAAPTAVAAVIRSPMRNRALRDVADLKDLYTSAFTCVGEKQLQQMLAHMKERLAGKIGNHNNNAFKLRKLFKMYDTQGTGKIAIEDFRVMTEAFGMQLDDDSLLALFHTLDPTATGSIDYEALMRGLLDEDYYRLYISGAANAAETRPASAATLLAAQHAAAIRTKAAPNADKLRQVFASFDTAHSGVLDPMSFWAAAAAAGVVLSEAEKWHVMRTASTLATSPGQQTAVVDWAAFLALCT